VTVNEVLISGPCSASRPASRADHSMKAPAVPTSLQKERAEAATREAATL
jgi:hypothetical protein